MGEHPRTWDETFEQAGYSPVPDPMEAHRDALAAVLQHGGLPSVRYDRDPVGDYCRAALQREVERR